MSERILVAGCGYVGTALGLELASRGHEVFGLRRNVSALPAGLRPFSGDLTDPALELPEDLDRVFYTAAAGARSEEAYRAAYVTGLTRVLELCEARDPLPRRFVFTSSTGVYGQRDGSLVDEDSPTEPSSATGLLLLEGEARLAASPIPATTARLSGIYGPGRESRIDAVLERRVTIPAEGGPSTNRIHLRDIVRALIHLSELDAPLSTVLVTDDEPTRYGPFLAWMAARLGVELDVTKGSGHARGDKRCSNRRLKSTGFTLEYPSFREGYGELIEDRLG